MSPSEAGTTSGTTRRPDGTPIAPARRGAGGPEVDGPSVPVVASEADEDCPEGADDQERPEWDICSEGHTAQDEEAADDSAGRERADHESGDGARESGQQAHRDQQLEVPDPDGARPERDRDDEEEARDRERGKDGPAELPGNERVPASDGRDQGDRDQRKRDEVGQEALVQVRGEQERERQEVAAEEEHLPDLVTLP